MAVAIHSKMPERFQRDRLAAYKRGEYLAVVGDEKFKEGFNHPPMKVICDYQRGSLVDKAQITGRGARKWWNGAKERWEGMTFIDTVVYIGSEDTRKDKSCRASALSAAILVSQILGETSVSRLGLGTELGKEGSIEKEPRKIDGNRKRLFPGDLNVEEYIELEDIRSIHAEISKIKREGFREISEEDLLTLEEKMKLTGLGAASIIARLGKECPTGLKKVIIENWRSGDTSTADPEHWNAVIKVLDDGLPHNKRITEADRLNLLEQSRQKRMGARALVKALETNDLSITEGMVKAWMEGKTKYTSGKQPFFDPGLSP